MKSSVQSLWLLCHRTEDGRALRLSFGFPELHWHPSYAAVEKKIKIKSLFFFFLSSSRLSGLYFVILRVSQASRAAPQAILNPPVLFSYYRGIVAGLTSSSRLYLVLPPVMYLLFFLFFILPPAIERIVCCHAALGTDSSATLSLIFQ